MIESKDNDGQNKNRGNDSTSTPVLDNFSRDLIKLAEEGKLDPVIGREREINRIAQILSRRKKNNPIIIGEPGCGKTAIAEGLAIKIFNGECPRNLMDKKIVSLDMTSIVAGTKYRGQFEERMKVIIEELQNAPNIIVFIDEIHTIVGAGNSSGSLDASNIFKPALARGEIQCIGATTLDEYRKNFEKDGALERRFQKVIVDSATKEETIQILKNSKDIYENYHKVIYSD
jgi:ATP-dependent Clp protease ATP-binding subunit ClpC